MLVNVVFYGSQLWVLLVIPLGVLAGSDAAHAGRRGWLAAFTVLIVLAPIAAKTDPVATAVEYLLTPSCLLGNSSCTVGPQPQILIMAEWVAALLLVPLAGLIYSFTSDRSPANTPAGSGRGERRLIVVCAVIGLVVMSALGFLANSNFIIQHFSSGTVEHISYVTYVQELMIPVWFTLVAALPVAVASVAMAHAARTGRRAWVAGWIVVIVLAVLAADLFDVVGYALIGLGTASASGGVMPFQQQLQDINVAAPVVVLLVALLYALAIRPQQRVAALAGA